LFLFFERLNLNAWDKVHVSKRLFSRSFGAAKVAHMGKPWIEVIKQAQLKQAQSMKIDPSNFYK
jgi:hypothetical protein